MEQSLKNRLTYGPLMLLTLFALLWFDHNAQAWTRAAGWNHLKTPDGPPHERRALSEIYTLRSRSPKSPVGRKTSSAMSSRKP